MSPCLIFRTQPCSVCLPTELHQEFQGQTHGQTRVLPLSNDKPHAHGRTGLRLRLSGAPHGPHRSPRSHLRQRTSAKVLQKLESGTFWGNSSCGSRWKSSSLSSRHGCFFEATESNSCASIAALPSDITRSALPALWKGRAVFCGLN